ncbi:MAG TPA: tetraacyldisaccharide 4'-kinase, partial [Anaeromyxobacteraceae bacterium]|nr:tetraacyldisaccharide 4'-kinase [Anaeromyxobacteraceae bacterium]
VLDASSPFGNGHCLPAGPNREPASALRRAGLAWLSHADRASPGALDALRRLARESTGRDPVESRHAPSGLADGRLEQSFPQGDLRGRRVALLTGVARPESVRRTVEGLGAEVAALHAFPDHHRFTAAEVAAALGALEAAGASLLVTTEKDAVRLPDAAAADPRIRALRVDAEILRGEASLEAALAAALARAPGAEVRP